MDHSHYGSTPQGKDGEHHVEDAGTFGGQGSTVCFFAAFECFTCVWLSLCIFAMLSGQPILIIFVLFGCCFHCCTQCIVGFVDIGNVKQMLESLKDGMDDGETAHVIEELKKVPPKVKVIAEAYHETTDHNSDGPSSTTTHIDHTEEKDFVYASWKDMSGHLTGLDEYKVASIEVVPKIQTDAGTDASLTSLTEQLLTKCRQAARGRQTRSRQKISLNHPKYEVGEAGKVFITCSPGEKPAGWMSTENYDMCRFAWPGLGSLYRIRFFTSVANLRYTMTKLISVNNQQGVGWNAYEV